MKGTAEDPKGLISEAFRMDELSAAECRSIFLDWALSLPDDRDARATLEVLIGRHVDAETTHPMAEVMRDGLARYDTPRRRGGWRARARDTKTS